MRFAIFHAVCALWVLWRFWLPMNAPRVVKVAGFVVTLLIAAFPAVTATFFGGLVSPELPAWVLAAGNGCVFALTVLAGLTLLREVVIFLSVLAGRSGERMHRFVQKDRRVAIGMTAAAVGISAFGLRQGLRVPDVKEMTVPIEDLPAGLEGMRIVQLSDLHASALLRAPHMKDLVASVNSLSPDLVVITGDLVDGEVDVRSEDVAPLAELRARHGVIAVEGNHEHYLDYEGWMKKIPSLGIRLLRNEWRAVEHNGATLVVGGVTDPKKDREFFFPISPSTPESTTRLCVLTCSFRGTPMAGSSLRSPSWWRSSTRPSCGAGMRLSMRGSTCIRARASGTDSPCASGCQARSPSSRYPERSKA